MEYIETVSGTNIEIENSNGDTANSVKLLGDTQQNNYSGRNLFNYKDTINVGSAITVDDEGWVTCTYNNTSGSGTVFQNYFTNNLNLTENTQYNILVEIKNVSGTGRLYVCSTNGNTQGQFNSSAEFSFTSLQSNTIINTLKTTKNNLTGVTQGTRTFVAFFAGQSGSITFRLSVLADTSITPSQFIYEPYVGGTTSPNPDYPQEIITVSGSNTITVSDGTNVNEYTLDLGNLELCKISDYQDYIYKDGVKWYIHKEIGKRILNGSENWQFYGDSRWKFRLNVNDIQPFTNNTYNAPTTVICSHFTVTNWNNANNNGMFTGMRDINTTLSFAYNDMTTLADFKSWLSNNNVTVYYVLNSPIIIEITNELLVNELNSLMRTHLPYGTTYITSQGDLPIILDITYNNWNKYINPSDREALLDGTATIETKIITNKFVNNYIDYNVFETFDMDNNNTTTVYSMHVEGNKEYLFSTLSDDIGLGISYCEVTELPQSFDDIEGWIYHHDDRFIRDGQIPYSPNTTSQSIHTTTYTNYILCIPFFYSLPSLTNIYEGTFSVYTQEPFALTQDNSIISWNHEDFRYVKDQGWIGQFVARQLTGELKNISDDFNITDEDLELQLGVRTNNNTNWYSLGNFLVSKVTDDEVNDKTSFEALDYTKKFNKTYEDRMTYPCTAGELAQDVCDQCGVELGNNVFKNSDYIIEGNVFNNNETCRDVMKAIGKLAFSWVRVDWDNKVYFDFYKQNEVNEFNKANNSKYYNLKTQKEKFGPVNRIIIGYSQIEGERTKIEDGDSIDANGLCELTIYDNPLVYTQEQRESIIASASDLLGLEYMPLNTLTVGHPWLQGDNLFEITDMEGNTFNTIPFDRTIQYFGHIKTAIDVATATKTNTEYAYESDIARAAYNAEIQVNKITGEITALTSRTTVVENDIKNTYTMEQTNELIQNAERGITNIFSESGGNNIFRNTGLWFKGNNTDVVSNKNLFEMPTNFSKTENGITLNVNTNGSISITGNATDFFSADIPLPVPTTVHGNHVLSYRCVGEVNSVLEMSFRDNTLTSGSELASFYSYGNDSDFYINAFGSYECTNLYIFIDDSNSGHYDCTLYIQLEEGTTATEWEPYHYTYQVDSYEFWDGNVEQIKEEKANNTRAMLLKNNTLSQEQIVPNGNYTVSFKYKKLINLANVKCVINDIEYPLTNTNDTEFVQTIEVSSQHINVKFITDIDDSCEIYDLMVNAGSVKLAYSQNQNETTTDTVNISKGITITSTDTDTTFKANADGIRTLDRNGNELTKFTDTGMTTKKMIVEDTSEIVGLLVQQVGNQTWFTKL